MKGARGQARGRRKSRAGWSASARGGSLRLEDASRFAGRERRGGPIRSDGLPAASRGSSRALYNGIGVRKGDPLGTALKTALPSMIDDGGCATIMARWGVDKEGILHKAVLVTAADPDPR